MTNGRTESIIEKETFQKCIIFTLGIVLLTICIFGIIGDGLSVVIFLRKKFQTYSINIYLAALSVADLIVLTLALPLYGVGALLVFCEDRQTLLFHLAFCNLFYPIVYMFHCCSIWLFVAITVDRWLAISKPFSVVNHNRTLVVRALKVTGAIFLTAVLFNLCRFWEITIEFNINTNLTEPVMKLRKNTLYLLFYITAGNVTFIYLIPFLVVAYYTIRIRLAISKSRTRRQKISTSDMDDNQTNRMLQFVVLCYICCYTPTFILTILEYARPEIFSKTIGYIFGVINNILVLLNASTTFLFYMNFCTRYRQEANYIFATLSCAPPEELRLLTERNHFSHLWHGLNLSPSISASRRSATDSHHRASFSSSKYSIEQPQKLTLQSQSSTPSSSKSFWSVISTATSSSLEIKPSNSRRILRKTKQEMLVRKSTKQSSHLMDENKECHSTNPSNLPSDIADTLL